jgi:hypothetical protein
MAGLPGCPRTAAATVQSPPSGHGSHVTVSLPVMMAYSVLAHRRYVHWNVASGPTDEKSFARTCRVYLHANMREEGGAMG